MRRMARDFPSAATHCTARCNPWHIPRKAQRRDRRSRRAAARAEVAALRCVERALKGVADEVIRTRTSFTEDQPRLAWRASPRKARRRRAPRLTDEATARLAVRGRNAVAAAGAAFSAA